MIESLHCTVSGRVQHVGFRAFVLSQALHLGLTGWVRNVEGGRVEVLAQGPKDALAELVNRLSQGPPLAKVTGVRTMWTQDEAQSQAFQIRR